MHWLSQSAETLIAACAPNNSGQHTLDVVVIGSGYGGAVAALRFAEHGLNVAVLERGKEYVAGEFPNDVSQVGKYVRSELATATGVTTQGYEDGLFDFRIGLRAGALIGNGLGGGSLINAGVGLEPDERVFKSDDWPAALQQADMTGWYDCARRMHELQIPGQPADGHTQPINMTHTFKHQRMQDLRANTQRYRNRPVGDEKTDIQFEAATLAVQLDSPAPQHLGPRKPCIGCGDCVTGCNNQAKLSLTSTYLPQAVRAGAEIFTGLTVLHISCDTLGDADFPWQVHFVRTDERKLQHGLEKRNHPDAPDRSQLVYTLRARRVVLAAGTFGSTEIMLRSRRLGLLLSNTALGVGVSGNGDDVSYAYDMAYTANAFGNGSKGNGVDSHKAVGPTISSLIRFTDPDDFKRNTLVQDGAVPGLMQAVVHELLTTLGTVAQLGNWGIRNRDGADPMALNPSALKRTLTLLGMGHDTAGGVIVYDRAADRVKWGWPKAAEETASALHTARMKGAVKDLGGIYLQNPAVGPLPDAMKDVLSGPQPGGAVFTVHPLGGCRMGDIPLTGVVNHWGQAWTAEGGLHDGLFVMDGSIVPSSLGANPMLTITPLAERACSLILQSVPKKSKAAAPLPDYPATPEPLKTDTASHTGTRLTEVLRGKLNLTSASNKTAVTQKFKSNFAGLVTIDAALFLEFDVPHWQAFFDDKKHTVSIVTDASHANNYTASRLVLQNGDDPALVLKITNGTVDFFCQRHDIWLTRADRYVRTLLTYAIGRWLPDRSYKKTTFWQLSKFLISALKLISQANEVREYRYQIDFTDSNQQTYRATGVKTIEAAASWGALRVWLGKRLKGKWPAPERLSMWQQLTEVDLQLSVRNSAPQALGRMPTQQPLASGRLAMDLPDMLRRIPPQFGLKGDTLHALQEFAGYPMLIMRTMLKTRLLDFKSPDYKPGLPNTDPALVQKPAGYFELDQVIYPDLPGINGQAAVRAEPATLLEVPLTWPTSADQEPEKIRLGLVRYKQTKLSRNTTDEIHKVKAIVLLNGFDLSTKPFVATELNGIGAGNLATQLHHAGWDVWLFEYRPSPLLDASAQYSTMDDIAAFDIPAAVDHIIACVSAELGIDQNNTQIFAFSHCVGSASLAMSLLAGNLKRSGDDGVLDKLAGVLFSQFHPFVVGSSTSQMRLQFAAFLKNALQIETLQFTAGAEKANLMYAMMDRLFASAHYFEPGKPPAYMHTAHAEKCPHEDDLRRPHEDTTTCKRMTGLLSRLFEHDQLLPETHEKLDQYFGRSNMGVFLHGAKCVSYERLVNSDGQNAYVTARAIKDNLSMPLMMMHGDKNVLFDKESMVRSQCELNRVLGVGGPSGLNRVLALSKNAHFDCTIGKNAPHDIFPHVVKFFDEAFDLQPDYAVRADAQKYCRACLARTGPIVGWVRPGSAGTTLVRVWIEVDDTTSEEPLAALTILQTGAARKMQAWLIQGQMLESLAIDSFASQYKPSNTIRPTGAAIHYAIADLEIPNDQLANVQIEMVSIHSGEDSAQNLLIGNAVHAARLPRGWGEPIGAANIGLTNPPSAPTVYNPSGTDTRNTRLAQIADFDVSTDPDIFLGPLKLELDKRNATARQANPGTLSRTNRTLLAYSQRVLKPQEAQLRCTDSGNLCFYAAACQHPGLTGFETERASSSLLKASNTISVAKPKFMLMLGDQIYADVRAGVLDTESTIEKLLPRYRDAFGNSAGFRKLVQKLPLHMVIDDHEIDDNWSQEKRLVSNADIALASNAKAAFSGFQFEHGPGFPDDLKNPSQRVEGFNTSYSHNGIPFIVLDTRTNRRRVPDRQILESGQWRWLEKWLVDEQAKGPHPKFVVSGSVLAPGLKANTGSPSPRGADNWQLSHTERSRMLSFIASHHIENVVFLSSDYHCSAAAEISFTHSKVKAWAIVAPPLHAPMRFANVQASEVCDAEVISLSNGDANVSSTSWDGEGWLTCQITKIDAAHFHVGLAFNLRKLDEKDWPAQAITINWRM